MYASRREDITKQRRRYWESFGNVKGSICISSFPKPLIHNGNFDINSVFLSFTLLTLDNLGVKSPNFRAVSFPRIPGASSWITISLCLLSLYKLTSAWKLPITVSGFPPKSNNSLDDFWLTHFTRLIFMHFHSF